MCDLLGLGVGEADLEWLGLGLGLGLDEGLDDRLGLDDGLELAAARVCDAAPAASEPGAAGKSTMPSVIALRPSKAAIDRDLLTTALPPLPACAVAAW